MSKTFFMKKASNFIRSVPFKVGKFHFYLFILLTLL